MDELESKLSEKKDLLGGILAETEKQGAFLGRGDITGLADSIAARQGFMDRIDELDNSIHDASSPSNTAVRDAVTSLRAEIEALLAEIMAKDAENLENAGVLNKSIMTGIKETSAERSLLAYRQAGGSSNKYINRKG